MKELKQKWVEAMIAEIKGEIKHRRMYASFNMKCEADGLYRALQIIEKYVRKNEKDNKEDEK